MWIHLVSQAAHPVVGAVSDPVAEGDKTIRGGGKAVRPLKEEVFLLGPLVRTDRIFEEKQMADRAAEFTHPHVDDMNFFPTAVAVKKVVVFELHFELLPLAGFLVSGFTARTQKCLLYHLYVPAKVFGHVRVFNVFVKLVRLILAVNGGDFDLPLAGPCSPWNAELGEPSHAPTPVDFILEVAHADAVADELVGQDLVVEFKLLPLFERVVKFFS